MRSYRQLCGVAKALDAVGDRWSLLIVRELTLLGECRYTDLLNGLPGIATNLLTDRLRRLEEVGVLVREQVPPPVATAVFRLTERGEALLPVLRELGRWGGPLLVEGGDDDAFRSHWMTLPLRTYHRDPTPDGPPVTIEVRTGDRPMLIETADGEVRAHPGTAEHPDAVLSGPPRLVIGVLSGRVPLAEARRGGLECTGDSGVLARVRSTSA